MPEPYDPHLPPSNLSTPWNRPGSTSQGPSRSPRVASVQAQINDTVELMRENITKVTERQEQLASLEARTESLAVTSQAFRRSADRVRKNMWYVSTFVY